MEKLPLFTYYFRYFRTALECTSGWIYIVHTCKYVCKTLGIRKTRTTPLHSQSDGLVERFIILTSREQSDWDLHLPLVLWAYQMAVQDYLTKCTPAALLFGQELRTPVELVFETPPEPEMEGESSMDYYCQLQN